MISVIINTFNAEKHLRKVLDTVKGFDEVVICDMYSTDNTISIAKEYGCKIIYHENTGFVEPARGFAIRAATFPWIFVVDADELVPPDLKEFLYKAIKQPNCPAGYKIPLKNYFMGKFMRCTYPNYVLRFFKKEGTYWPPYVHAQPKIDGIVRSIPISRKDLAFIHLADDSVSISLRKTNLYTEQEIKKRENKKYSIASLIIETGFRFFKLYILKGGVLDGKAGFIYCSFNAFYKFVTIAKILEIRNQSNEIDDDIKKVYQE